jgi:type IV pilus assembly protein PilY1
MNVLSRHHLLALLLCPVLSYADDSDLFLDCRADQILAAPAIPVSLHPNGTPLNQVYLGMFRPDSGPRWPGNLKLYQFALNEPDVVSGTSQMVLADRRGEAAREGAGPINPTAVSFWTTSPDAPDGPTTEKGGAAQQLRDSFTFDSTNSERTAYICLDCSPGTALRPNPATGFDVKNSALTDGTFGAPLRPGERDLLINWIRGVDNIGENHEPIGGPRLAIIGDVVHSQPFALNYGKAGGGCSATETGDVVVFYASNDGLLHAVQGGTNPSGGRELWSLITQEALSASKRLRDNAPPIQLPTAVPASQTGKPYVLDGDLSAYTPDVDHNCSPDRAILFMPLRRGGRSIYAIDITEKNNPKLLWKKGQLDSGYAELGQTWSQLKPIRLSPDRTAILFGAGYDPGAEDRPYDSGARRYGSPAREPSMGRGIFIIQPETGAVLRFFGPANGLKDSIPATAAIANNPSTRLAEAAYLGDTGGNIWKISLTDASTGLTTTDATKWSLTKLASLGDPADPHKSGSNARKFLNSPDIITIKGGRVLMIGSGDREKPFDRTVQNRLYMLKDTQGQTPLQCEGDEKDCALFDATDPSRTIPVDAPGWYVRLGSGEKTVGAAVTDNGVTYFPVHGYADPSGSDCSQTRLGIARIYGIKSDTGGPALYKDSLGNPTRFENLATAGIPPAPALAIIPVSRNQNGVTTTEHHSIVLSGTHVASDTLLPQKRIFIYWYQEGLDY